jgi:hypothetical protein
LSPRSGGHPQQLEQDRRREVVGQVAGHPQRTGRRERRGIEVQKIGRDDLRRGRQARRQIRGEVAIEFDRRQMRDARRQPQGQRARARTDLEKSIVRPRRDRVDDLVGPRRREEVLAEPPSRADRRVRAAPIESRYACSIESPRQNFSSICSISSSLMPK